MDIPVWLLGLAAVAATAGGAAAWVSNRALARRVAELRDDVSQLEGERSAGADAGLAMLSQRVGQLERDISGMISALEPFSPATRTAHVSPAAPTAPDTQSSEGDLREAHAEAAFAAACPQAPARDVAFADTEAMEFPATTH